jgi:hypothetical protein
MEEGSKSEKRLKFDRFLPGFLRQSKKSPGRKGHDDVLPEPVPDGHVPNTDPSIVDNQGANTTARSPPTEPPTEPAATSVQKKAAVNTDADREELPTSVVIAQDRLKKAEEKLEKKLSADLLRSGDFEIKASTNINTLADNIGSTLVTLMEQRNIEKSEQSHARDLITECAKKTIPFIETGLTIAEV